MSKSRYFNTAVFGNETEPLHYATYDLPDKIKGIGPIDILGSATTTQYTWQLGDRLDKLASRFYGDDEYWWVIALANGIDYPLGIQPGTTLLIPTDVTPVLQQLNLV